jgi:hypothetical protein
MSEVKVPKYFSEGVKKITEEFDREYPDYKPEPN